MDETEQGFALGAQSLEERGVRAVGDSSMQRDVSFMSEYVFFSGDSLGQDRGHERVLANRPFHRHFVKVDQGSYPIRHDAAFLALDGLLYSNLRIKWNE